MIVTVIGAGYVGLTSAAVFAELGNTVYAVRKNQEKVDALKKGVMPFYEPDLGEIVEQNIKAGRLIPTTSYEESVPISDVVFICVGTPSGEHGEADLSQVFSAATEIAKNLKNYTVVVDKSTVPIGTAKKVKELLLQHTSQGATFDVASIPEFLRQGSALEDTRKPDRVIIGTDSKKAQEVLTQLHEPFPGERLFTNIPTAEMIKYAANSFLATSISFINNVSMLCEKINVDVTMVAKGMRLDKRIGKHAFLDAGCGYGGSCFPKDVKAFIHIADNHGVDFKVLKAVEDVNRAMKEQLVFKMKFLLGELQGKTVAIWGLAFKPDTDDLREAPSLVLIKELLQNQVVVRAYDPVAILQTKKLFPEVIYCNNALEAAQGADCLAIVNEWKEFKECDKEQLRAVMKALNIVDGRNICDPVAMRALGFNYASFGKG